MEEVDRAKVQRADVLGRGVRALHERDNGVADGGQRLEPPRGDGHGEADELDEVARDDGPQ
ncbi:MAG: hypothetical protein INR71_15635 [Terriglobus roseus]|nr:hypothetical protein [Terriglobus roseus]